MNQKVEVGAFYFNNSRTWFKKIAVVLLSAYVSLNTQIIAISNQKGGVGKTTTCVNLGIGLAQTGKKVLLVDADPQGSLTISLGYPRPDELSVTLSDVMSKILTDQPIQPGEGIIHHSEGVDLMPADIQLSGMEVSLVNAMSRETILKQYLNTVKGQYSHVLIDCQPSLGMLTVNALAAANRIIIPVQAEYLPAKGLFGFTVSGKAVYGDARYGFTVYGKPGRNK